eukprot:364072-Chlamydomonas_euryale.AAC.17
MVWGGVAGVARVAARLALRLRREAALQVLRQGWLLGVAGRLFFRGASPKTHVPQTSRRSTPAPPLQLHIASIYLLQLFVGVDTQVMRRGRVRRV